MNAIADSLVDNSMLTKLFVILVLVAILASLGYGLYTLVVDRGESTRTVKALTVRVGLSVGLFLLLLVLFATGVLKPHPGPGLGASSRPPLPAAVGSPPPPPPGTRP